MRRNRKVTFRSFISKLFAKKERDNDGNVIGFYKVFNKPQLIGTLIRVNKKLALRVIGEMKDDFTQNVLKVKLR